MPSRCAGGDAGLLLERPQGAGLPKYSCNVIRKSNNKIDLMCLIGVPLVEAISCWSAANSGFILYFIGFYGRFCGSLQVVGKVLNK
jgi:hypothetical protein